MTQNFLLIAAGFVTLLIEPLSAAQLIAAMRIRCGQCDLQRVVPD